MGMLIEGVWRQQADGTIVNGAYRRAASTLDKSISADVIDSIARGSSRFVLLASLSCPWSHRALLVRAIKSLDRHIPLHLAGGPRTEGYGILSDGPLRLDGETPHHAHQLYTRTNPSYTGRVTVPLLWDSERQRIVSNDSASLMRAFDRVAGPGFTLAPSHLKQDIDRLNTVIHEGLANAVYRAGLAQTQAAYDAAVEDVFTTLDSLEARLKTSRFLFERILTETDLRLFATLVRFDAVYATHFRCTRHRLTDYPSLWGFARDLYQWQGVSRTVDFGTILEGYYLNDGDQNPHGIVAELPQVDWMSNPGRDALGSAKVWGANGYAVKVSAAVNA